MDVLYFSQPISGSPNGLIEANYGAAFYTQGSYSMLNYSGLVPQSGSGSWIPVTYKPRRIPSSYELFLPLDNTPYLYQMTSSVGGYFGWKLLLIGNPFIFVTGPTPTPTPSGGPTPTPTPTPTPAI